MRRTITAISATEKRVVALCDDGSLWLLVETYFADSEADFRKWQKLPPIPQDCFGEMTAVEKVAAGMTASECEAYAAKAQAYPDIWHGPGLSGKEPKA